MTVRVTVTRGAERHGKGLERQVEAGRQGEKEEEDATSICRASSWKVPWHRRCARARGLRLHASTKKTQCCNWFFCAHRMRRRSQVTSNSGESVITDHLMHGRGLLRLELPCVQGPLPTATSPSTTPAKFGHGASHQRALVPGGFACLPHSPVHTQSPRTQDSKKPDNCCGVGHSWVPAVDCALGSAHLATSATC